MILEVKKMKKFWKSISSWSLEAKTGLVLSLTATILFGSVLVLENQSKQSPSSSGDVGVISSHSSINTSSSSDSLGPVVTEEAFAKPFTVPAEIKRYYYDMNDSDDIRAQAVVPIPGKPSAYMKSVGVDYAYPSSFDVLASFTGVVSDRISDPTYGNIVVIKHDETGLTAYYCSLSSFNVTKGEQVSQGDVIGKSGESLYTSGLGSSLHFEVKKNDKYLNPEKLYSKVITQI